MTTRHLLLFLFSLMISVGKIFASDGALIGEFSVSTTLKVHFSKGNLQYQASANTWRFAEHQWDYVGDDSYGTVYANDVKCSNTLISATYTGWIDLFGWGTSGWNSGANAYQPYSVSVQSSDYSPGGKSNSDLTGNYANSDWGVYNFIDSNVAGTWRTLTRDEWNYLFSTRTNATSKRGLATVNNINGYIFLPDNWEKPNGITFIANAADETYNNYSTEEWLLMESAGAIFLPLGGHRYSGTTLHMASVYGYYWTSTHVDDSRAWRFIRDDKGVRFEEGGRISGSSVRLVQNSSVYESTTYTITWSNYDGSTLTTLSVGLGATPTYTSETPTKPATAQYTYSFKGWEPEITTVTGDATYTAQYDSIVNNYTITFRDYNGAELQSGSVAYDAVPEYNGETPIKPANAQYTYFFKGWEPEITAVTGNATYTAQFDSVVNNYTIVFNNYNGTELQSGSVAYGLTPAYEGATPTKPATAQYTYSFKGWEPAVVAVTGNATYTAQYDSVVNNYTITFNNYNGAELQSSSVSYGQTPEYNGETPTKPTTAQYTYSFKGWEPAVVAVTGNATYTAQYDSVVNNYTITFSNYNGTQLQSGSVAYGQTPVYDGVTPTKPATAQYTYSFNGWDPEIVAVTGNATYTAQFDSTLIEYEIDTNPGSEPIEGGSVHIDGTPHYGETITLTPIEEDGYVFVEWSDGNTDNPREIVVDGNIAIYPIFHKCEKIIFNIAQTIYKGSSYSFGGKELTAKGIYYDTIPLANGCDSVVELKLSVVKAPNFTLRVVVNDETMGTVTGTGSYKAGTSVTITATPASSKYIFVRWYNEDENIDVYENPYTFTLNRNLQLRAVFRKAPRKAPKSTSQTK